MQNSQQYFQEVMANPETAIPKTILKKVTEIVILRQLKLGYVVGARGGGGFAMAKDDESGEWSPPAFVKTLEGSFGLRIHRYERDIPDRTDDDLDGRESIATICSRRPSL